SRGSNGHHRKPRPATAEHRPHGDRSGPTRSGAHTRSAHPHRPRQRKYPAGHAQPTHARSLTVTSRRRSPATMVCSNVMSRSTSEPKPLDETWHRVVSPLEALSHGRDQGLTVRDGSHHVPDAPHHVPYPRVV